MNISSHVRLARDQLLGRRDVLCLQLLDGCQSLCGVGPRSFGAGGTADDPKVAIKAMLPNIAPSATSQQRFLREAQAAAALEHDHIVPILHVGEDRGASFIVMPYLKGESLADRLKRPEPISIAFVAQVGQEIAAALAAAHSQGLIHRDLKPGNVWLEMKEDDGQSEEASSPRAKLLDLGLARLTQAEENEHLTQSGTIQGTPGFMAPEQVNGEKLNGRADLFSLGCVLYRMATGKTAFTGDSVSARLMAVTTQTPAPPSQKGPPAMPNSPRRSFP